MRRSLAVLASVGLGIGTIALASPAQATSESVTVKIESGNVKFFEDTTQVTQIEATQITFTNQTGSDITVTSQLLSRPIFGSCETGCKIGNLLSTTFNVDASAQAEPVTVSSQAAGFPQADLEITYNGTGGGGDDSGSSAPAPAAPAVVDVALDQITSEVLRTWASTATVGSWKQLPESSEIIGVDENAGKTFLGAATIPNFPVDIAQRQVDNGWGAYEIFNEDGDLTSVFIPAGQWMNINGPTRLYAIWGN